MSLRFFHLGKIIPTFMELNCQIGITYSIHLSVKLYIYILPLFLFYSTRFSVFLCSFSFHFYFIRNPEIILPNKTIFLHLFLAQTTHTTLTLHLILTQTSYAVHSLHLFLTQIPHTTPFLLTTRHKFKAQERDKEK